MIISIQFSGVLEYSFIQMQNEKKEKPKQTKNKHQDIVWNMYNVYWLASQEFLKRSLVFCCSFNNLPFSPEGEVHTYNNMPSWAA